MRVYWNMFKLIFSVFLFAYLDSITDGHVALNLRDILIEDAKSLGIEQSTHDHATLKINTNGTASSNCVPLVNCPAHVRLNNNKYCQTPAGRTGIYCSTGQNHTEYPMNGPRSNLINMNRASWLMIKKKSEEELDELKQQEKNLLEKSDSAVLFPGPATYGHFRNSRAFNHLDLSHIIKVSDNAMKMAILTRHLKDRQEISNEFLELGYLSQETPPDFTCPGKVQCMENPVKYRRIDGACNNHLRPSWGAPFTAYSRLLPPSYDDGIWMVRRSVFDNEPLPSARLISTSLIDDINAPNGNFTLMLMQFGQFLSHDLTQAMDTSYPNGSAISCCEEDGLNPLSDDLSHYACMVISVPHNDPFFVKYKQRCMSFVRSTLAANHDCTLGSAQQMNKLSHYIDGSTIYGSTPEQTGELRSFEQGKLKTFDDYGRDLLPLSKDPLSCLTMEQGSACFQSGDTRTNQMITLVIMHTLFLREHNRLADILYQMNPHWEDEEIFLEARRIVIAEIQMIVYNEFLPAILGPSIMNEFNLFLEEGKNYAFDYSPWINPSITNEFSTAAFRFGHSLVDGRLKVASNSKIEEIIALPEVMFYPSRMRRQEFMDEVLNTLTSQPIQDFDNHMSYALTRYMFRGGNPFGVDLAAINIQRGRDHGLRPYNDYRQLVGLNRLRSFDELKPQIKKKLAGIYKSVDDIDLWVGGLLEEKTPGSLVGPTFADIIANQFARLKRGDRYFFENGPGINPGSFTTDQLEQIRKVSMSRIICDNSDKNLLLNQAPNAFRIPGAKGNEYVKCDGPGIPSMDLSFWQDK